MYAQVLESIIPIGCKGDLFESPPEVLVAVDARHPNIIRTYQHAARISRGYNGQVGSRSRNHLVRHTPFSDISGAACPSSATPLLPLMCVRPASTPPQAVSCHLQTWSLTPKTNIGHPDVARATTGNHPKPQKPNPKT